MSWNRMTLEVVKELVAEGERRQALGHKYMQITKEWDRSPYNWDHVRVLPGVYGRIVGQLSERRHLVEVEVADLLPVLRHALEQALRR